MWERGIKQDVGAGAMGRKDGDKLEALGRGREAETRRGKNRQGTESEYNKFEVKPVGSKVSTPCCLGILGKLQNHYPRRVCFSLYMCHEVRI